MASAGDVPTSVQLYSGKRAARHLEFGTPFSKRLRTADIIKKASSQEPCRNKFILGEREVCPEVSAGRQAAAEEQAALVRSKMSAGNSGLCPCSGSYYVRKQDRHLQVKWKDAVEGARPARYTHNQVSTGFLIVLIYGMLICHSTKVGLFMWFIKNDCNLGNTFDMT
jgi:hypothetical protein